MNFASSRVWAATAFSYCMLAFIAQAPIAKAVPVSLELDALRAVQTFPLEKGDDQAYMLVTGIANGKEFSEQFPKDKPWSVGPKKPVATVKEPLILWKGDLADGEFAVVSVTLMQGNLVDAAKNKEYTDKLAAAGKTVAERSKPKLTQTDFENLCSQTIKAQLPVIKDIKKTFSRDLKTDHFGGLFNVTVWNNAGKIVKHLDPIGLTFGEHDGIDPKIYTKLKNTRPNVLIKDPATGEWSEQQLSPLTDDQMAIEVKMLENEIVKVNGKPTKNTTDYVAELQLKADGKPLKWELGGLQQGKDDIHNYWDFAE